MRELGDNVDDSGDRIANVLNELEWRRARRMRRMGVGTKRFCGDGSVAKSKGKEAVKTSLKPV